MSQKADETDLERHKLELEIKSFPERQKLENSKLQLEIIALRRSFWRTLATALLTATVTMLIAVGGWLFQANKYREDAHETAIKHREEVFTKVLEDFASSNPSVRAAATVILPQFVTPEYEKQIINLLVNRLSSEDDVTVTEQIVVALNKIGRPALPECVNTNKRAQVAFARSVGRLCWNCV